MLLRVALLALMAVAGWAEELAIYGIVTGTTGPVEGAVVTVYVRNGSRMITATDSKGQYRFDGLDVAAYGVTFEMTGYQTVSRRVALSYEDDAGKIDVKLERGR